jgi:hypothetical protein
VIGISFSILATMKWLTLVSVLSFSSNISAEKARFDFYRLYDIAIDNEVHLNLMQQIIDYPDGVILF